MYIQNIHVSIVRPPYESSDDCHPSDSPDIRHPSPPFLLRTTSGNIVGRISNYGPYTLCGSWIDFSPT